MHSRAWLCRVSWEKLSVVMAQYFAIHPKNPQGRLIQQAAHIVRGGGIIVYPTDSSYALGCHIGDKEAVERLRRIRGVDEDHHLTLVCKDLSEIARYAQVENRIYRMLRAATPGSYTFILRASKEVPKRLQHPKRRTIGIRVPDHLVVRELLDALDEPLLSTTLMLPGDDLPLHDMDEIQERVGSRVDCIIDSGPCGVQPTTVVDLSAEWPVLVRQGKGDPAVFGARA